MQQKIYVESMQQKFHGISLILYFLVTAFIFLMEIVSLRGYLYKKYHAIHENKYCKTMELAVNLKKM